jgi:hypothetical protein
MSTYWNWDRISEASEQELNTLVESMSKSERKIFEMEKKQLTESNTQYDSEAELASDPEGQETYEPRAAAEKYWADRHRLRVFDPAGDFTDDGIEHELQAEGQGTPENQPDNPSSVTFQQLKGMITRS